MSNGGLEVSFSICVKVLSTPIHIKYNSKEKHSCIYTKLDKCRLNQAPNAFLFRRLNCRLHTVVSIAYSMSLASCSLLMVFLHLIAKRNNVEICTKYVLSNIGFYEKIHNFFYGLQNSVLFSNLNSRGQEESIKPKN